MMNSPGDRNAPFQYVPSSQRGELRFTWNGGEYADVFFAGAEYPHASANTTPDDWEGEAWRAKIPPTQDAFELLCEDWLRHADPTEIARPLDGPLEPREAAALLSGLHPADMTPDNLRQRLREIREADRDRDREAELLLEAHRRAARTKENNT